MTNGPGNLVSRRHGRSAGSLIAVIYPLLPRVRARRVQIGKKRARIGNDLIAGSGVFHLVDARKKQTLRVPLRV